MSLYSDIDGTFTLDGFSREVGIDEKQLFAWFHDSRVRTNSANKVVNHVEYAESKPGEKFVTTFITHGSPPPAGQQQFWSGSLVLEHRIVSVDAYRKV